MSRDRLVEGTLLWIRLRRRIEESGQARRRQRVDVLQEEPHQPTTLHQAGHPILTKT
jgi:hypothetical protein